MRKTLIALGAVAVVAALAAVALGGIPGKSGAISACYDRQSGLLRVYDAEGTPLKGCRSSERPISWNQIGPQGPAGTFSGTLKSRNQQFSLSVTNSGIELAGPTGSVKIDGAGISINAAGPVSVGGALIRLNGCKQPVNGSPTVCTG